MANCIDCGAPVGKTSLRCITDRGREIKVRSLHTTAAQDREILAMVAEGLNNSGIAVRKNISRVQARQRKLSALSREAERAARGI